jgi:flotillin
MKVLVKRKLKEILVKTSEANAVAIKGENEARIALHNQKQTRAEAALRTALASEKYKVQKH